eukprot:TRINITY_DN1846_c0_g1_i1.p1 TRINITY_DN1846_c0_g1~~TRINITY_DN1846_c0_g1_i1.p1  ORF type:complete len:448 (-),score=3.00 TRINITY_DN1846_c0_g1_i1:225-1568(-)
MKIEVGNTQVVKPAGPTPQTDLWISNVDIVISNEHNPSVFFYKPIQEEESPDFFSVDALKDSLSKVLATFYPMAGRLSRDCTGRLQITCNSEGVTLTDATTDAALEDLGDFVPDAELAQLVPAVDYSLGISSYPLMLVQVTRFRCGGVCIGIAMNHQVCDGSGALYFINSWAQVTRGLPISTPPVIERTPLKARSPPSVKFDHVEYHPPPSLKTASPQENCPTGEFKVGMFKLTREEIELLKQKCQEEGNKKYTTFEAVAGHVWRSACRARNLQVNQGVRFYIVVDSRRRLKPGLPLGYFGNAVLGTTPVAVAGDVVSKGVGFAAAKIHEAIVRMDDEYLRSAIDFLETQDELERFVSRAEICACPNFRLTTWGRLGIYDADFGWGRPVYMGPGAITFEGSAILLPSASNDGSMSVALSLLPHHLEAFQKYFHEIGETQNFRQHTED